MSFESQELHAYAGAPVEFYKFVMGSTTWRHSSGDVQESIADPTTPNVYTPTAIAREAVDYSKEDASGSLHVTVAFDHPVAALFVNYTPPQPVWLTVYTRHRGDPEVLPQWLGRVLSARFDGATAQLTCAPLSQSMQRRLSMAVAQRRCNHVLYSTACGVNRDSFKDTGCVLTLVSGNTIESTTFGTHEDGWYRNGWVERTNGERRFVVEHIGNVLTLMNPFPADLVVGGSVTAFAGCERTETACADKFSNLANHLGWPRIPTRNPQGGGSIV